MTLRVVHVGRRARGVRGVVARKADKAVQTGSQADFGIGRTDGQTQSAESSRAA